MTSSGKLLPHFATVNFSGYGISNITDPDVMRITQDEFAHDALTMTFWGSDVNADSLTSGSPLTVTWGTRSGQRVFNGYVNHPQRLNNALSTASDRSSRNSVTISCIGASWPMRQPGTQVWHNYTASQVVSEIATLFNFSQNIVFDSQVWPTLPMAGRTYFAFCAELAKRIGYTFFCNGVELVFKPRNTNPQQLKTDVVVYDYKADPNSLSTLVPTLGAANPSGGQLRNRYASAIDPRTNQVIYAGVSGSGTPTVLGAVQETPLFDEVLHHTVSTQQELNTVVAGAALHNQMYITADAFAAGNALLSPGSLVFVRNANGSQDGFWFVHQAVHDISPIAYTTTLSLGRDSLGSSAAFSVLPRSYTPAKAILVNGYWVAS